MSTILKNCGITLAILLIFGCSKQPQPTAQIGAHVSLNPEPVVQRASRLDLVLSDNEIKQMLISRSLASYPGNCLVLTIWIGRVVGVGSEAPISAPEVQVRFAMKVM